MSLTPGARPVLVDAEPQLFVADIDAACAFYRDKLGFRVELTWGTPPFYAQVARDGAVLNLRCVGQPPIDPGLRDRESLLATAMTLATRAQTETLAADLRAAGVTFFQDLKVEPWGAIDFIVRDLDGNLLLFAGPA